MNIYNHTRAGHNYQLINSRSLYILQIFLLLAFIQFPPQATAKQQGVISNIVIGGSGSDLGTFKQLATAFMKIEPAINVTVLPSLGSSGGVRALTSNFIDIALLSRAPKTHEQSNNLQYIHYAKTPLVFAVSTANKAVGVNTADLLKYYSGTRTTWPDGIQVRPILRPKSDSDTLTLLKSMPVFAKSMNNAYHRKSIIVAITDQDMTTHLKSIPGAIGTSTLSLIMSENVPLRALRLNGIMPSPKSLEQRQYKFAKDLYYATKNNPPKRVKRFLAFLKSKEAQKILEKTGHLIVTAEKPGINP